MLWKADSMTSVHRIFAGATFDVAGDRIAVSAANNFTYRP